IDEAITAATLNAAAALGRAGETGSIEAGKRADLVVHAVPNRYHLVYRFGVRRVRTVVASGRVVVDEGGVLPREGSEERRALLVVELVDVLRDLEIDRLLVLGGDDHLAVRALEDEVLLVEREPQLLRLVEDPVVDLLVVVPGRGEAALFLDEIAELVRVDA